MKVLVNGEEWNFEPNVPISMLISSLGFEAGSVAVACDGKFLPRAKWATTVVDGTEQIEILSPMQGG